MICFNPNDDKSNRVYLRCLKNNGYGFYFTKVFKFDILDDLYLYIVNEHDRRIKIGNHEYRFLTFYRNSCTKYDTYYDVCMKIRLIG